MEIILWIGFYLMTFYALLPALVSRIFGFRVFMRGRVEREVALTFDDGPDPVYTPQLLDLLKRYQARCTFFLVGAHAERHPDIVARIHEEGHVIGIHNYTHHSNWFMRPKGVKRHILRTSEVIKRITGVRPMYYRPPWGIVNLFDYRRLGHLQIVLWTSIFGDWRVRVGAEKLYRRMRSKLRPGEVFVLHDCGRTFGADEDAPGEMIKALERILEDGKRENLRFVGIDEMIRLTEEHKRRQQLGADADKVGDGAAAGSAVANAHDPAVSGSEDGAGAVVAVTEEAGRSSVAVAGAIARSAVAVAGEADQSAIANAEKTDPGKSGAVNAEEAETGKSGSAVRSARADNPDHRIGFLKRIVVAVWMLWEQIFHLVFRLKPIGDGTSFNYRIRKYSGPDITLRNQTKLQAGDYVMELHFENRMLFEVGMSSRSTIHTAIRLLREVERGLPEVAHALEEDANGDKVKALYGVSIIHRGSEGFGFQTFELPRGLFAWSANLYLRFMISVIHPDGGKRLRNHGEKLSPKMIIMEREELLSWKHRTGKQRPSRKARTGQLQSAHPVSGSLSFEPGMNADQAGRTM